MSRQLKILIADDDVDNAASLAELFELEDHRVVVTHNGQQAVDAYKLADFDLGFFDVMMPVKDGVESFLEIKRDHPEAQIYFMTGYSSEDRLDEAMANGAVGIFDKPVDLERMLNTIFVSSSKN
jgi:DNA-binding NtrC family response regulator